MVATRVRKLAEESSIVDGPATVGVWAAKDAEGNWGLKFNATGTPVSITSGQAVKSAEMVFVESDQGAGGTYDASVTVPAGSTVVDVIVVGTALWDDTTAATLTVGASDPDGYYTAVDLKATDLLADETLSFALAGGKAGAYIANSQVTPRRFAAATDIVASVAVTDGDGTAGRTRVIVLYVEGSSDDETAAVFTETP